jgi:hypothetical protein
MSAPLKQLYEKPFTRSSVSSSSSSTITAAGPSLLAGVETIQLTLLPSFLSSAECDRLIRVSTRRGFTRSVVGGMNQSSVSTIRTSHSATINRDSDPLIHEIKQRIARLVPNVTHENIGLYCVKYEVGQHYGAHCDDSVKSGRSNRRLHTVLIYLNTVAEGGETHFMRLGVKVKPQQGAALWWRNWPRGDADCHWVEGRHEALPPKSGVKVRNSARASVSIACNRSGGRARLCDSHSSLDLLCTRVTSLACVCC